MNDTPDFIAKKQFEIVFAKPLSERLAMLDSLFMFNRRLAIERIREAHPNCSGNELSAEFMEGLRKKLIK